MLEHDFDESPGYWIIMTADAVRRALAEEVAPHGVTYRQCQVLAFLALDGPLSQTALAERMRIEPPTLVGILDRMERDGWVRREGCRSDRRKKLVHPAPAAQPVWSKIVACGRRVRRRATRGLSVAQLAALRETLDRVCRNLHADISFQEKR